MLPDRLPATLFDTLPDELCDVDLRDVAAQVDPLVFKRGIAISKICKAQALTWDVREWSLTGVLNLNGNLLSAMVYFVIDSDPPRFEQGHCSCGLLSCEHGVAVLAFAIELVRSRLSREGPVSTPAWERSLHTLLNPSDDRTTFGQLRLATSSAVPLAIEIGIVGAPGQEGQVRAALKLNARLMRPGRNGGWVNNHLSWSRLGDVSSSSEFPSEQVRVLREIYALYNAGRQGGGYGYGYYSDDRDIDLAAFESRQFWSLLEDARVAGVRLIHTKNSLGELPEPAVAEFHLDVTQESPDGDYVVRPQLRVPGLELVAPLRFIGSTGHGVVFVDDILAMGAPPANWPVRLARMTTPVPEQLRAMLLQGIRLTVPVDEIDRFRDTYCPRLGRVATLISSDDSFTPPTISEPQLVLRASYGDDHELEVDWEWAYQVGSTEQRTAMGAPSMPLDYRDLEAERRLLSKVDLPLSSAGLPRAAEGEPPTGRLAGMDTMRFTTEVLPELTSRSGVVVEFDGLPADYREVGDSLQIGVSADEADGQTDWFDLGITITLEGREVPFAYLFSALSHGESHLLLSDGAYFSLDQPELVALRKLIEEAEALQDRTGQLSISRFQVGLWDELVQLGVVTRQAESWKQQAEVLRSLASAGTIEVASPPGTLDAKLRPYQLEGFGWLSFCWEAKLGGILADDMGLGKTLQALALICHAKAGDTSLPPFLVVAPTSVLSTWQAEAKRFAPHLRVVAITETGRRRGSSLPDAVAGADVVLTSYTLFRLENDDYLSLPWAGLLLDEAQNVKNHQAKIYQCVRRLPADFKVAMTGTPMENNVMELWSLLSIAAPGLFPNPKRFQEYYARPIEKGDSDLLAQLRRRIKPLMKRRTKGMVAKDLPAKQEQVLEIELHPKHRKIYQTHLQRERKKVLGLLNDMQKNRFTILRSLTLLRQLSLDPQLVDETYQAVPSHRLDALMEHLSDAIGGGHRALVFSQFTGYLSLVRSRLVSEGIEHAYLDGKTTKRAKVISSFKEGSAPVFLISLKAGGFGLNLTEADYCFLLDPWWNPATEAQAVDRTHRIGQTRNVMVYRMVAKDTIEEKVTALKERKAALFANVMDEGNAFGSSLTADDIRGLFA